MGTLTPCKAVHNLRFSSQGQEMMKRIQNDLSNAKIGGALLMSSTLHALFTKTTSVVRLDINVSRLTGRLYLKRLATGQRLQEPLLQEKHMK